MKIISNSDSFYIKELNIFVSFLKDNDNKLIFYKDSRDKKFLDSKNLRFLTKKEIEIIKDSFKINDNKLFYNNRLLLEEKDKGYYFQDRYNSADSFLIRFDNNYNCYFQITEYKKILEEVNIDAFNFLCLVTNK